MKEKTISSCNTFYREIFVCWRQPLPFMFLLLFTLEIKCRRCVSANNGKIRRKQQLLGCAFREIGTNACTLMYLEIDVRAALAFYIKSDHKN